MTVKAVSDAVIREAAALLIAGECVAIPTETVYGLAADALNPAAAERIYQAKNRPSNNPLIVHFADKDHLADFVTLPPEARILADAFWPGPMTLIVARRDPCPFPDRITAGLGTIAVRIPSHPTARAVIAATGKPLAAPSANASGEVSPTSAMHVAESLGGRVPLIIADGAAAIGLESTVIDCTVSPPAILRAGAVTAERIAEITGVMPVVEHAAGGDATPKSPGQLYRHYAPRRPVRLRAYDLEPGEALLAFGSTRFMPVERIDPRHILNLSETGDLEEAAHNLFAYLRKLDTYDVTRIAVMDVPQTGIGAAINDRLRRAAEG